jgi:hypothetical protein
VDTIFAGLVADFLQNTVAGHPIELAESAKKAAAEAKTWQGRLVELLKDSPEGKELIRVGAEKDMDFAAKMSRFSAAPVLKNGVFIREVPPKPTGRPAGEIAPPAPRKGKPIKVQVPLFPKNPEHPTPGQASGSTSAALSSAAAAAEASKKKHAASGAKPPAKKVALFSKKTVASLQVKAEVHHGHGHQIATEALKVALSKLEAKHAKGMAKGAAKGAAKPGAKIIPASGAKSGLGPKGVVVAAKVLAKVPAKAPVKSAPVETKKTVKHAAAKPTKGAKKK